MTPSPDYRRRTDREAEILAEIAICGELSVQWLRANRQRPAALQRLLDGGKLRRLPSKREDVLRFAEPAGPGFLAWLHVWLGGKA